MSSILLRLLVPALVGVGVMTPFLFVAHNNGYASAMKETRRLHKHWWQTELMLWSMISDVNAQGADLAHKFETVLDQDEIARRQFKSELSIYIQQRDEGRAAARQALELLDHIKKTDDWAAEPVSPDVVCVRDRPGCDHRSDDAEGGNDSGLREPAADNGDDL